MSDMIERQAVIDALYDWSNHSMTDAETWHLRQVIGDIKSMPSAQPEPCSLTADQIHTMKEQEYYRGYEDGRKSEPCEDCVSRKAVLKAIESLSDGEPIAPEDMAITVTYLPSVTPKPDQDALDNAYQEGYTAAEAKYRQMLEDDGK